MQRNLSFPSFSFPRVIVIVLFIHTAYLRKVLEESFADLGKNRFTVSVTYPVTCSMEASPFVATIRCRHYPKSFLRQ